ncbi:MAG: DUF4344 domain-containing metallopeptidase [Gemmatimonadetes bacterium]|nr:DUF4344 domain-containing metallopeptidase [Gemmatimonadota bacterium]
MRIPNLLAGALAALAFSSAPAAAQGRWLVAYPQAQDPVFASMQQMFAQQDVLANIVDPLNQYFPVSRDVTVELAECGRAGAFYDRTRPAVQLCYELLMELAESLMSGEEDGDQVFVGAFALILLHQVGHAFVDLMQLPVSAPPEEAADQLAAVMVGFADEDLQSAAEGAVALSEMQVDWENPGSGRTALSGRRLENLLCLLYGTSPDAHEWVVEEGHLPRARASRCEGRYQDVEAEWIEMLSEHVQS